MTNRLDADWLRTANNCRHKPMETRDGGFTIDTALHRCSVLPSPDAQPEPDNAHFWAICDAVCSVLLVLILALVIGGAV